MKIGTTLLLSVAMLLALGCVVSPTIPPLGVWHLDPPPLNSTQVDEATAKLFSPVEGKAVVYIYRPRKFVGWGMNRPIVFNDKYIASMGNGSFLRIVIPSGKYAIRSGTHHTFSDREIDVELGQVYFFGASPDVFSAVFPVRPDEAKGEILKLKMTDNPYNF